MENYSKNLVAVEDLLIAVQVSDGNDIIVIQGEASVDLAEFDLTPEEIKKFSKILRKMNALLAESFQKQFPASSVISEIRSQSS